jgi:hypothetical protein
MAEPDQPSPTKKQPSSSNKLEKAIRNTSTSKKQKLRSEQGFLKLDINIEEDSKLNPYDRPDLLGKNNRDPGLKFNFMNDC